MLQVLHRRWGHPSNSNMLVLAIFQWYRRRGHSFPQHFEVLLRCFKCRTCALCKIAHEYRVSQHLLAYRRSASDALEDMESITSSSKLCEYPFSIIMWILKLHLVNMLSCTRSSSLINASSQSIERKLSPQASMVNNNGCRYPTLASIPKFPPHLHFVPPMSIPLSQSAQEPTSQQHRLLPKHHRNMLRPLQQGGPNRPRPVTQLSH